jgi:hypothetical protein
MKPTCVEIVNEELKQLEGIYLRLKDKGSDPKLPGKGSREIWTPTQFGDLLGVSQSTANAYAIYCEHRSPKSVVITTGTGSRKGRRYFRGNYFRKLYSVWTLRKTLRMLTGPHWKKFYRLEDGVAVGRPNKHYAVRRLR